MIVEQSNLEMTNAYSFRFNYFKLVALIPIIGFFYVFYEYIISMYVGGIIHTYICAMIMVVNRYIREGIRKYVAERFGYKTELKLKTAVPNAVPEGMMNYREFVTIEVAPIVVILSACFFIYTAAYYLIPGTYAYRIILGSSILTLNIFYRNIRYIVLALGHRDDVFVHTHNAVKIYKKVEKQRESWDTY